MFSEMRDMARLIIAARQGHSVVGIDGLIDVWVTKYYKTAHIETLDTEIHDIGRNLRRMYLNKQARKITSHSIMETVTVFNQSTTTLQAGMQGKDDTCSVCGVYRAID